MVVLLRNTDLETGKNALLGQMSRFLTIPIELLVRILEQLDFRSLLACQRVRLCSACSPMLDIEYPEAMLGLWLSS